MAPTEPQDKQKKFKAEFEAWYEKMFDRDNLAHVTADMRKNTKALFSSFANRFDLVTREEFQVQQQMLAEALKKLEALEAQLAQHQPAVTKAKAKAKKTRSPKKKKENRPPDLS